MLRPDDTAIARVTEYVASQKNPLAVWVAGEWLVGDEGGWGIGRVRLASRY